MKSVYEQLIRTWYTQKCDRRLNAFKIIFWSRRGSLICAVVWSSLIRFGHILFIFLSFFFFLLIVGSLSTVYLLMCNDLWFAFYSYFSIPSKMRPSFDQDETVLHVLLPKAWIHWQDLRNRSFILSFFPFLILGNSVSSVYLLLRNNLLFVFTLIFSVPCNMSA